MSMRREVDLNNELADLSGVYMAMWKALESFDIRADRWSEPVDFGSRKQRIRTAQNTLTRFRGDYGDSHERELTRDVEKYERLLGRLAAGEDFEAVASTFCNTMRQRGSDLADKSVSWVRGADSSLGGGTDP